ncbi:hypothetical protein ERO13_A05G211600v2 [Gossypium hirsutum]|uniref:Uncharacterized protein n=3 Tax=Gossypium TaxID=3633 RepID=A0A1U8PP52_GOSHI|nr:uncharacterized protein LOC107961267 [Gossypium hirsutum]KAB2082780.1 hypothetical protein ES319_A05G220800v1 [Gossypium barbadense]KAG4200445.1 hypothetical protein ERO13_A05G211600v2 [Gossypium hirsutum]TYJ35283.1 hypothetical protein E1A91_A05G226300v1 [Gossypium mustelinum]
MGDPFNSTPNPLSFLWFTFNFRAFTAKFMAATTTSSTTTTTSSNSSGFFNLRSNNVRPSSSATRGSPPAACGKLDGVGVWFVNGVAAAFFASLERCSCIRIATEDDGEDANDVPLIQSDGNVRHLAGTTSRKRTRKGNNKQG